MYISRIRAVYLLVLLPNFVTMSSLKANRWVNFGVSRSWRKARDQVIIGWLYIATNAVRCRITGSKNGDFDVFPANRIIVWEFISNDQIVVSGANHSTNLKKTFQTWLLINFCRFEENRNITIYGIFTKEKRSNLGLVMVKERGPRFFLGGSSGASFPLLRKNFNPSLLIGKGGIR